jgi:hypothetical protein
MNKKEYLQDLLTLLTESQLSLFNRMYPNGCDSKQIDWAIQQIKNTILSMNKKTDLLIDIKKEFEEFKTNSLDDYRNLEKLLKEQDKELKEAYSDIEKLSSPINIQNLDVQKKLDKLYALECGGVDNWDWYGECMSTIYEDE